MIAFQRLFALFACGLAIAGCAAPATPQSAPADRVSAAPSTRPGAVKTDPLTPTPKLTLSDPCPTRLHDLCGPLLLYLTTNFRLPERIDELRDMPGSDAMGDFYCPTSAQPYVYNPAGVVGANVSQRAVIYDAVSSHAGYRWAIVVREATPNAPFIVEVVAWPESRFPKGSGSGVQGSGSEGSGSEGRISSPEP